ncbi:PepSY-associated TM helix domain-containing protein [Sphingomonas sp. MMS12-HWE2-04]|uniref:PepSY-associated TM helix domain-containing protein n=1 Tax=Sphingomonas sp. MMS12-HWE2-04 TaxID=3234199 RepID=UPI00384D4EAB
MSVRQRMDWLHSWVGIVFGWLGFAIALTGTAAVFKGEMGDWMRPEVAAQVAPDTALANGLRWLAANESNAPAWYLTAPDSRSGTAQVLLQPGGTGDYRLWALDPATGNPKGIRDTLGGEFLYRFHFELELPYPWGRMIAAIGAMALLIALISGIVTHRRFFADFFTLRTGKGKRSWLDAHNVLGVLPIPFHLMITLTGVLMLVTLTLPWATLGVYGGDTAAAARELFPAYVERPAAETPGRLADPAAMIAQARQQFGGAPIGRISVENPGDARSTVLMWQNDEQAVPYSKASVAFDGASGALISRYREARPAMTTYNFLYGLHMGRFGDAATRWLYFACGLAFSATIATGLVLWSLSRADIADRKHAAVARLSAGAVAGLVLAIAALLWGNRLLPLGLAGRADWEVRGFFLAWAAALAWSAAVPARWGWRSLLWANAAGWGLLPVVSAGSVGRGLLVTPGDGLFVAGDLLCLAMAATCGFAAKRMGVARPARPLRRAVAA